MSGLHKLWYKPLVSVLYYKRLETLGYKLLFIDSMSFIFSTCAYMIFFSAVCTTFIFSYTYYISLQMVFFDSWWISALRA